MFLLRVQRHGHGGDTAHLTDEVESAKGHNATPFVNSRVPSLSSRAKRGNPVANATFNVDGRNRPDEAPRKPVNVLAMTGLRQSVRVGIHDAYRGELAPEAVGQSHEHAPPKHLRRVV